MYNGIITHHDGRTIAVTIGKSEEVRAPRKTKALEESGWVITDDVTQMVQAFLAGQRQGDIPKDADFDAWSETVLELNLHVTDKQIQQAVVMGQMTEEEAARLKKAMELDASGEAAPPRD